MTEKEIKEINIHDKMNRAIIDESSNTLNIRLNVTKEISFLIIVVKLFSKKDTTKECNIIVHGAGKDFNIKSDTKYNDFDTCKKEIERIIELILAII